MRQKRPMFEQLLAAHEFSSEKPSVVDTHKLVLTMLVFSINANKDFCFEQLLAAHEFSSEKTFGEDLHFISRVLNAGLF